MNEVKVTVTTSEGYVLDYFFVQKDIPTLALAAEIRETIELRYDTSEEQS